MLAGTNNTENDTGVRVRVKRLVIHPKFTVGPYWVDAEEFGIKQVLKRSGSVESVFLVTFERVLSAGL